MSYIGSTPTTQSFIAGTDSFNGTGSATNFTLSRLVNSANDIQVVVNNVVQYPPNYSVSGNTLTISPAPSAGTNNVYVRYLSTTLQSITVPGGSTVVGGFNVTDKVGISTTNPQGLLHVVGGSTVASGIFASSGADTTNLGSTPPLLNVLYGSSLRSWAPGLDTEFLLERSGSVALTLAATVGGVCTINFGDADDEDIGEIAYVHSDDSMRFRVNAAERARITSTGDLRFNSGYGSVATAYGCRAWVNFNGTGTVAIRASGNVSSITDNGTGDYTVNFTTAMPDANYGFVTGSNSRSAGNDGPVILQDPSNAPETGSIRILCGLPGSISLGFTGNKFDVSYVNIAIFR
jgi:hypothetical protein